MNQALGWVCKNADWIGPILSIILPASVLSGWTDKFPPWIAHLVNFLGANWGDIYRVLAGASTTPANTGANSNA